MAELRGGSTSGNQEIVTQNSRPYLAGATISSVDGSYLQYGPNALGGYLYVGATSSKISANVAQVISTDGNLHLDSGTGQNLYLNFYSNRPIYVFNGGFNITKDGGSISVNGNITAPAFIGSGANLTGTASGLSVASAAYATNAGGLTGGDSAFYGLLYATTSGDLNTYNNPGITSGEYTGTTNKPSGYGNGHFFQITDADGTNVKTQFYFDSDGERLAIRMQWGQYGIRSWRTLIHSGNIGNSTAGYSTYSNLLNCNGPYSPDNRNYRIPWWNSLTGGAGGYNQMYCTDSLYFQPQTGRLLSNRFTANTVPVSADISTATDGAINFELSSVPVGSFATFLHGTSVIPNQGYIDHISIGSYRHANNSWGSIFFGIGGNDNYPTNYFLMKYGGTISHSSGSITLSGTVYGGAFQISSSREVKQDISVSKIKASDIVSKLNIVDFKYVGEKYQRIGFIAEDTDMLLSGSDRKHMDYTNCIGVLLKAFQEQSSELQSMKEEIERLKEKAYGRT